MTTLKSHSVSQDYVTAENHKQICLRIRENWTEVYSDLDGR